MTEQTLYTIKDIVNNLEYGNSNLFNMLDFLNITPEERKRIEDSIIVTAEKINMIKESKISNLHEHLDINYIKTTCKY